MNTTTVNLGATETLACTYNACGNVCNVCVCVLVYDCHEPMKIFKIHFVLRFSGSKEIVVCQSVINDLNCSIWGYHKVRK